ncbi:MAG TPA: ABC transporter ATP-binding protein, partial [Verrucomicrobiae bacterium]
LLLPIIGKIVFSMDDSSPLMNLGKRTPGVVRSIVEPFVAFLTQMSQAHPHTGKIIAISLIPLVVFLRGLFSYLNVYLMQWAAVRSIVDLRIKLFEHLQSLSLSFFQKKNTGQLISLVNSDTITLQSTISGALPVMIKDPVTVVTLAVLLFSLHTYLTFIILLTFPICVLPVLIYTKKVRNSSARIQSSAAESSGLLHEGFTGIRIVKAYNLEQTVVARFRQSCQQFTSHYMRIIRSQEIPGPLIEFMGSLGVASLFYIFALKARTSPVDFLQFVFTVFLMYRPIKNLVRLHSQLEAARSASARVFQVLEIKPDIVDPPAPVPLHARNADIVYDIPHFSYGDKNVLHDIHLTVKGGLMVALVGSSGSGKTTLTNLLLRFYDPQKGSVRISGTNIRDVAMKDLRSQIGVVTQETLLFNDTVRNNIAMGRPGASHAEVESAARHAHAHDFIMEKKGGYDFVIGERGNLFSGGQRQRLAIARAILKNAPILILDEATSSLDTESERAIQAALDGLMQGRTTICIAHRLSTIQRADLIVVMDKGRIVEEGKHSELIKNGGIYRHLYELQFSDLALRP